MSVQFFNLRNLVGVVKDRLVVEPNERGPLRYDLVDCYHSLGWNLENGNGQDLKNGCESNLDSRGELRHADADDYTTSAEFSSTVT